MNRDPNAPIQMFNQDDFELPCVSYSSHASHAQSEGRLQRPKTIATLRAEVRLWQTVAVICSAVAVIAVYLMAMAMNGLIR